MGSRALVSRLRGKAGVSKRAHRERRRLYLSSSAICRPTVDPKTPSSKRALDRGGHGPWAMGHGPWAMACRSHGRANQMLLFQKKKKGAGAPRTFIFAAKLDHGALPCHWTAIATKAIGQRVPVQTRGILHGPEEQSRPRGGKSLGVTDQPQYPRL